MIEKLINHPIEYALDITPGTTIMTSGYDNEPEELTNCVIYDNKDNEIERQYQTVYDAAMGAFLDQSDQVQTIDPRYGARNMEVAAVFLNTALQAAKEKASLKQHKDKLTKIEAPKTVNNNLIMDRNKLLKMLQEE